MAESVTNANGTETTERTTEESEEYELSVALVAARRLLFPLAGVLLAVLYVENTWGRIRPGNLRYPYFLIGLLSVLAFSLVVEELVKLARQDHEERAALVDSVRHSAYQWRRSLGLLVLAFVYAALIEPLGFFPASVAGLLSVMYVGGVRDPKVAVGVTALVLAGVYLVFVRLIGLVPPQGPLGV